MRITIDIPKEDIAKAIKLFHFRKISGEELEDLEADPISKIALGVCAEAQRLARGKKQNKTNPPPEGAYGGMPVPGVEGR